MRLPLRNSCRHATTASSRGDVIVGLPFGLAGLDAPWRFFLGIGIRMPRRLRPMAMPFRERHSYVVLRLPLVESSQNLQADYLWKRWMTLFCMPEGEHKLMPFPKWRRCEVLPLM